ncbi:MAG: 16S rRNA (guanine(966)-N(2))-methyltransferase RsmD [Campylobacterota bacterium]|nr:16S rRNA (guanine(966)-N(2))-methyltransferase RsmD [Campylobacterota bacterium]
MAKKKNKIITTKIIAGKYKGKLLQLPELDVTRSSKSILKESFFNVLQYDIIDTVFIEAFGGSGSIGLEALSRGAKHTYFIEINRNSYRTLDANCASIEPQSCTLIFGDTFEKLPNIEQNRSLISEPTVVYIDPPFDFRDGMEDIYVQSFDMVKNFTNENIFMVAFEHVTGLKMPETLGLFTLTKSKKFGKSSLSYYTQNV